MDVHGEYPPLLTHLPANALRRSDAEYLLTLTQSDWLVKHEQKNREPSPHMRDSLSDELRRIEAVQQKLRVLL